jgi:hypothetical protein
MAGDHLFRGLAGPLSDLAEVGRELGIVIAAGDRDPAAGHVRRQAARDQRHDLRLEAAARRLERIVAHHQRAHGRHRLGDTGQAACLGLAADGGVQGHDPTVDLRGNFVAELDGEGGVAAGQVPNAHIC